MNKINRIFLVSLFLYLFSFVNFAEAFVVHNYYYGPGWHPREWNGHGYYWRQRNLRGEYGYYPYNNYYARFCKRYMEYYRQCGYGGSGTLGCYYTPITTIRCW